MLCHSVLIKTVLKPVKLPQTIIRVRQTKLQFGNCNIKDPMRENVYLFPEAQGKPLQAAREVSRSKQPV